MYVFVECKSRKTARKRAPWSVVSAKVYGGFLVFDSWIAYKIWKGQY